LIKVFSARFILALVVLIVSSVPSAAPASSGETCSALFQSSASSPANSLANSPAGFSAELSRPPYDAANGLVTDRVPITLETVSQAYPMGVFPYDMTAAGNGVWFNPPKRGVLDFSELRIGQSDRKVLKRLEAAIERGELRVTYDQAFERVIRSCADMQRLRRNPTTGALDSEGTWIFEPVIQAYTGLFKAGRAHSVEIWRGDELVAGSYGVSVNGVFSGESMFHTIPEVAKLTFIHMIDHLKSRGFTWMDVQVAPPDSTSLTVKWGAKEISRDEFRKRQTEAASRALDW